MEERCRCTRKFGECVYGRCRDEPILDGKCVDHITREDLANLWKKCIDLEGKRGYKSALNRAKKITNAIIETGSTYTTF